MKARKGTKSNMLTYQRNRKISFNQRLLETQTIQKLLKVHKLIIGTFGDAEVYK